MIIDGHAHAAGNFFEKETLVAELDRLGVDKVVLAPMGVKRGLNYALPYLGRLFPGSDLSAYINYIIHFFGRFKDIMYDVPNEYLFKLKEQCPDRIIQFYWADPNDPNIMAELKAHLPLWHYSGVKLHQVVSNFNSNQESMHRIADFCAANNLPLFIHLFKRQHIIEFIELLQQHPETKFIVGHMIGFELLVERAFDLNNYWFDISPYSLQSEKRVMKTLNKYGADRLMLGSDTPFGKNGLEKNIKRVRALPISEIDKAKILGGNLQSLLGI